LREPLEESNGGSMEELRNTEG